jgi:hypothetical protein
MNLLTAVRKGIFSVYPGKRAEYCPHHSVGKERIYPPLFGRKWIDNVIKYYYSEGKEWGYTRHYSRGKKGWIIYTLHTTVLRRKRADMSTVFQEEKEGNGGKHPLILETS